MHQRCQCALSMHAHAPFLEMQGMHASWAGQAQVYTTAGLPTLGCSCGKMTCDAGSILWVPCAGAYALAQSNGQGSAFAHAAASANSNSILSCYSALQSSASATATAQAGSGGFNNGFNTGGSQAIGQVCHTAAACLTRHACSLSGEAPDGSGILRGPPGVHRALGRGC